MWLWGQNPEMEYYDSWRFPSWDNPIVYPGGREDPEIKLLELTTTPEWFMQEIGADFASFVGKIYGEWDDTVHIRRHRYNPAWPNYIAFDWGFVNPLAAIEFQVDPWDNIYVWREHYQSYVTLEGHLAHLKAREQPEGYHIDCCFGDAADPEATLYVSTHFAPCVSDPEAKVNWREGVELVKQFLKEYETGVQIDEYGTPETKPKFTVDPSCVNMIREFNNYRAAEGKAGRNPREVANNVDDHCMDAIRYGIVHLYKLGAQHHLADVEVVGGNVYSEGYAQSTPAMLAPSRGDSFFTMDQEF
jgi:hypothetical protein